MPIIPEQEDQDMRAARAKSNGDPISTYKSGMMVISVSPTMWEA
jgi:hypothetical protein